MGITKSIAISCPDIRAKIKLVSKFFDVSSDVDITIIETIYQECSNDWIRISPEARRRMCVRSGLKEATFTVALNRLVEKGAIAKKSKLCMLHPAYLDLDKTDKLLINF